MTFQEKIKVLETLYSENSEFELILNKILEMSIQSIQNKISEYEKILKNYESKYNLKSKDFYEKFESGKLGDSMDYMEWSGVYELYLKAGNKIKTIGIAA